MALTEDQIQAFISALNERVRNLKDSEEIRCPICTNKQWQVVGLRLGNLGLYPKGVEFS